MKRRIITSVTAALLLASLVASPAASAAPGSGSAGVFAHAVVNATVDYAVVDHDHIDLRSNAPWRLTLVGPGGTREVSGPKTGAVPMRLEIPEGTTDYFVTMER